MGKACCDKMEKYLKSTGCELGKINGDAWLDTTAYDDDRNRRS